MFSLGILRPHIWFMVGNCIGLWFFMIFWRWMKSCSILSLKAFPRGFTNITLSETNNAQTNAKQTSTRKKCSSMQIQGTSCLERAAERTAKQTPWSLWCSDTQSPYETLESQGFDSKNIWCTGFQPQDSRLGLGVAARRAASTKIHAQVWPEKAWTWTEHPVWRHPIQCLFSQTSPSCCPVAAKGTTRKKDWQSAEVLKSEWIQVSPDFTQIWCSEIWVNLKSEWIQSKSSAFPIHVLGNSLGSLTSS